MSLVFFGLISIGLFTSALNAKALGASIVYAVGLSLVYPNEYQGLGLMALYIPAVLLANFRD